MNKAKGFARISVMLILTISTLLVACGTPNSSPTTTTPPTTSAPPSSSSKPSVTPTPTPSGSPTPVRGGTINWTEPASPSAIGAPSQPSGQGFGASFIAETLFIAEKGGVLGPMLATSYDVVTDPPSMTIHLRKGVKFSDGTDFNADAAKFNLDNIKVAPNWISTATYWKSIDKVDDYTVRINFTIWQNRILASFSYNGVGTQVSPTTYQANGVEWAKTHAIGTGPFIETDFQQDVHLNMVKNPNYWDTGKPYIDAVNLSYVADSLTQSAQFKSGQADVINCATNAQQANDLKSLGFPIISTLAGSFSLHPDSLNPDSPWSNVKVRQAAEYALDKEQIAKTFGYGFWPAAYQVHSPNSIAYDSNLAGRKYDVAKATQLMADAGMSSGFKTTIYMTTGGNTNIPASIQAYWAKININAEIKLLDAATMTSYTQKGWTNGLLLSQFIEYPNPATGWNLSYGVPSANNVSMARPDNWKDLMTAVLSTNTAEASPNKALEDAAYDYAMVIPMYFGSYNWATTTKVHDTGLGTGGINNVFRPQNMWLSK